MSVKKDLLAEIDRKIARKKEMAARALERMTIDAFVMAYMKNMEEIAEMIDGPDEWYELSARARESLHGQMRSFDDKCDVVISWADEDSLTPQVNGVHIKWSKEYQNKWNVEPELFIDVLTLLLNKD